MSRTPVSLREATVDDAPFLAELWHEATRKAGRQDQVADLEIIIKAAAASAEQRLVIAEYDGEPAGAVLLRVDTLSPLNLEPVVQAVSPHVLPSCQRRGRRLGADGRGGDLGRGARDRARRDGRVVRLPQRQPVHGPALTRGRWRWSGWPPRTPSAPG